MTDTTPPISIPTGGDGRPTAVVRTSEWYDDAEMTLPFPNGWQVDVKKMGGHDSPALTDEQVRGALHNPIDTKRIAEIADGKKTACITFDDLARPTPSGRVMPFILEELHVAGIKDDDIIFQCAAGTHAPLFQPDMVAKLGPEIVRDYEVWNHDCFHGAVPVGTTARGNDVRLNSRFVNADVKICVSGVKLHSMTGYGGGAKSIVPGIAWIKTAYHIHEVINPDCETTKGFLSNEVRLDMEDAARLVGVDMSINIVMNGHRQVAGLFAGDIVSAHRAAVTCSHELGSTPMPDNPDVVVCNAYPQSVEANKEFDLARKTLRDGGTAVLIADTPAGQRKIHYLGWIENGGGERPKRKTGLPVGQAGQVIVFNRYPAKWDDLEYSEEVHIASSWDQVVEQLQAAHGENTHAAIFPTAALQHEPSMPLRM